MYILIDNMQRHSIKWKVTDNTSQSINKSVDTSINQIFNHQSISPRIDIVSGICSKYHSLSYFIYVVSTLGIALVNKGNRLWRGGIQWTNSP